MVNIKSFFENKGSYLRHHSFILSLKGDSLPSRLLVLGDVRKIPSHGPDEIVHKEGIEFPSRGFNEQTYDRGIAEGFPVWEVGTHRTIKIRNGNDLADDMLLSRPSPCLRISGPVIFPVVLIRNSDRDLRDLVQRCEEGRAIDRMGTSSLSIQLH
jgi:hypothetical protein